RVDRVEARARADLERGPAAEKSGQDAEVAIQRRAATEMRVQVADVLPDRRDAVTPIEIEQRLGHFATRTSRSARKRDTAAESPSSGAHGANTVSSRRNGPPVVS